MWQVTWLLGWGGEQDPALPCWLPMSWQLGLSATELEEWKVSDPQLCEELRWDCTWIQKGEPMNLVTSACPLPASPIKEQPVLCPDG